MKVTEEEFFSTHTISEEEKIEYERPYENHNDEYTGIVSPTEPIADDKRGDRLTVYMQNGEVGFCKANNEKVPDEYKLLHSATTAEHDDRTDYFQAVDKSALNKAFTDTIDRIAEYGEKYKNIV